MFDGKAVATPNPDSFVVDLPARSAGVLKIVNLGAPAQPSVLKVADIASMKTGTASTFRAQPASSHDVVVSYRWSFGDGVTLEGPEVSHAYTRPGT